jgi:hypothetical protein
MADSGRKDDILLEQHIHDEEQRYEEIERRLLAIETSLQELTNAWTQAKGALTLLKVLAGIGAAIAATYTFLHSNFTVIPK